MLGAMVVAATVVGQTPPIPTFETREELVRFLAELDRTRASSGDASESREVARDALLPRPVITKAAIERAVMLYAPPTEFVTELLSEFETYDDSLDPVRETAQSVRAGTEDERVLQEVGAQLVRPPNREWLMFPGMETDGADPGFRADPSDPRWQILADASRRIAQRDHAVWLRLRACNSAMISQMEAIAEDHEFDDAAVFVTRVLLESLYDGRWARSMTGMPEQAEVTELFPLDLDGGPQPAIWIDLAEALGRPDLVGTLKETSISSVRAHDTAVAGLVRRTFEALPSPRGFSGLGGMPSEKESARSLDRAIRQWRTRQACVDAAVAEFASGLTAFSPGERAVLTEAVALRRLAEMGVGTATAPLVARLAPHLPEQTAERVSDLTAVLSEVAAAHALRLLRTCRERFEARARAEGASTEEVRKLDERIETWVFIFEEQVSVIVEEIAVMLDAASADRLFRASEQSIGRRRPSWVRPETQRYSHPSRVSP